MSNPQLSKSELVQARMLLGEIRRRLNDLSSGNKDLRFAYNRKIYKELQYDERGTPTWRRKLKRLKYEAQAKRCAQCREPLEPNGRNGELDRFVAVEGYTVTNTQLVCHKCHRADQERRGFR
jgi:hypothetical protein